MTIHNLPIQVAPAPVVQRSPEWFAQRVGKFTGSQYSCLMAGPDTDTYKNYIREKAWERLTGKAVQGFTNDAMQHGIDTEPQARAYYEFVTDTVVEEVGFLVHPDYPYLGVSPDGLVGSDGLLEIKCPQPKTHIEYLASKKLPAKYKAQVQGQLMVARRDWCDFVSFHPDSEYQSIVRVYADDKYITQLIDRAKIADEAVEELITKIKEAA
jgi:putative phage-type endonuclease